MASVSLKMLLYNKAKFFATVVGISCLFFLSAAQVGLLVGWCHTTSAVIVHTEADLWVMAKQTPAFDYGTPIPEHRVQQVREIPGIEWAEGMFMGWNTWQRSDGRRVNIEMIGLDRSLVGAPWRLRSGEVRDLTLPDSVIIDELYLGDLGVVEIGDEAEIYGQRARVVAVSEGVRTFTASPFVFSSLSSARRYDRRYADNEVTYVLARCAPGVSPDLMRRRIEEAVPHVDCHTRRGFAELTVRYWMLETGVGITVVVTALLGFVVSALVISQTLYAVTQDHRVHYATLVALGFGRTQLSLGILFQSVLLGGAGVIGGSALFWIGAALSARTPIPLETTPSVHCGIVLLSFAAAALGTLVSIRAVLNTDPTQVFGV